MEHEKPELDWLTEARTAVNADPAFRKLGSADFTLGLVLGDQGRLVSFEAFEVAAVADASPHDMRDADVVLEMAPRDWNVYLRRRAAGDGETILSLDLAHRLIRARDPLARLKFERYHRSIQMFLDAGAAVVTAEPAG